MVALKIKPQIQHMYLPDQTLQPQIPRSGEEGEGWIGNFHGSRYLRETRIDAQGF